jgi:homoserine kinase type II
LGPAGWRRLADDCRDAADTVSAGLRDLIDNEIAALAASWPKDLPQGVIHADLFPDNVLFLSEKISGIIDLYFACNDALAYDLAVALNAWCFESDGAYNLTNGRALFSGYETRRPLSPGEREALPILCRGAALRFLLTRLYDWLNHNPAALVRPKDPREFLRRLRFHRAVNDARAYGL